MKIARELGVHVVWHPHNVGYGGNQKTCYLEALQRGAEIVVMLHPDGQYEPEPDPEADRADRATARPTSCSAPGWPSPAPPARRGMPLYKRVANRVADDGRERRPAARELTDLHTGYRAYGRELLLTVPFLRNSIDFVFDSELLMQASHFGFRIAEVPGAHPLLRRRVVGRTLGLDGLRREDAVVGGAADLAPRARAALAPSSPPDGGRHASVAASAALAAPGRRTLLFCVALVLSGGVLLLWLSDLTFWRDEWAFILDRRGGGIDIYPRSLRRAAAGGPVAVYKLLIAVFGIESPLPFQIAHVAVFADQLVLFVYVRRRVGEWLALAGGAPDPLPRPGVGRPAVPVPDQLLRLGRLRVGALLALDREDRRGDLIAARAARDRALLLSTSRSRSWSRRRSTSALTRDRFRRALGGRDPDRVLVRLVLRLGSGGAELRLLPQLPTLIGYVADGFSSSLSSLLGLAIPRDEMTINPLDWGRPLLVIAIAAGVWRVAKVGVAAMPRRLWAVLAAQLVFWSLTGLNAAFFGQATSGRYQIVGVVLMGDDRRRAAPRASGSGGWVIAVVVAIGLLAALANFSLLRDNGRRPRRDRRAAARAGSPRSSSPGARSRRDFELTEENSGVDYLGIVDAGSYFSAIDAFGSPAYTPDELAAAPDAARVAADRVFAAALGLGLHRRRRRPPGPPADRSRSGASRP